jgi:hypothetical protein
LVPSRRQRRPRFNTCWNCSVIGRALRPTMPPPAGKDIWRCLRPRRHLRQNYAGAARKHPSLSPSPLDEAHRARILSANIIRLDKFGHPCARGILDHVAGVEDLFLAKATYDAACKRWPGQDDHPAHGRTCSRGKPQDTARLTGGCQCDVF